MPDKAFLVDKQSFFTDNRDKTIQDINTLDKAYSFTLIHQNKTQIEQEFNHLYSALKDYSTLKELQNVSQEEVLLFGKYLMHCAALLERFYSAYGKHEEASQYQTHQKNLSEWVEKKENFTGKNRSQEPLGFGDKILADLIALRDLPLRASKIRDWASLINITRIQLVFSRIAVSQLILAANNFHWLNYLDEWFGWNITSDTLLENLNGTRQVGNFLSVSIFALRFLINLAMMLKHTFLPSDEEKEVSRWDRFKFEFEKRHCDLINDVVWGTVNCLTNYASYFNIAAPVANTITAAFLGFDVLLLSYRAILARQIYQNKKAQYEAELDGLLVGETDPAIVFKRTILTKQLEELDITWGATKVNYIFNISAAMLLGAGFSASLLLSTPASSVCFLISAIAIAMYLSADSYSKYHEMSLRHEQKATEQSAQALSQARQDFTLGMVKNTLMPITFMTVLALSWPAAFILAGAYLFYQKGYLSGGQPAPQPEPNANPGSNTNEPVTVAVAAP